METKINKVSAYYLRTPDGAIYGPVDIGTLCIWATDARVIPGCEWSERKDVWFPVEDIPELRLNWSVQLADGTVYGPLNLLAIRVLATEKSIPLGAKLSEMGTGRKAVLDDSVIPLLEEEFHQMLAGCGSWMSATVGALREAQRVALSKAIESDSKLVDLQARIENSDKDLAVSMRLTEALSHQLNEAQTTLRNNVTLIHELEKTVAHGKTQILAQETEMRTKVTLLEKACQETQQRENLLAAQLIQEQERAQKVLIEERTALLKETQSALQKKETLIQQLETMVAQGKTQAETQATKMRSLMEERAALSKEAQSALQKKETLIQQLETTVARGKTQAETQAAEMRSKVAVLEKTLQKTKHEADRLVAQLVKAQESYQTLQKDSARKEKESSDKLKRVEKEIRDSTELVAETMREVERREFQLRDLNKKLDQRECVSSKPGAVVEVEAIHSEVLHAETLGPMEAEAWIAPPSVVEPSVSQPGTKANKPGILNSVEAHLQMELRQWEVLKKKQKQQKKAICKWF